MRGKKVEIHLIRRESASKGEKDLWVLEMVGGGREER